MVDKNKLERIRYIKRRLTQIRNLMDDRKTYLRQNNVDDTVDIGFRSEVAVLNAERIDLNTELDVLMAEIG